MENADADIKVRRAEELATLRRKQRSAHEKMLDLEKASGEAWEELNETADRVWEDLKTGVADAQARFR